VGSLSWETVLQKLLQRGSFPRYAVLQEQAVLAWVPHGVTSPASKPAPAWAPLSHWVHRSWQEPAPAQALYRVSLLQASTCSSMGSSMGCRCISVPLWTSMGCRSTACLTIDFITGCRGKVSAPVPGASLPPPSLILVSAELFLLCSLTPLSQLPSHRRFFPLLKYLITEVLPPSLIGLVLASSGSILAVARTGSVRYGRGFSQLLTKATPVAPLPPRLPKACHANPQHYCRI